MAPLRKIVFYCHNVKSLGHIVRSICLADATLAHAPSEVILLTGCRALPDIPIPAAVRLVELPPVPPSKFAPERPEIIRQRKDMILAFLQAEQPDLLHVDTVPLGQDDELLPSFLLAAAGNIRTRFVLGSSYPSRQHLLSSPNPEVHLALAQYICCLAYNHPSLGESEWPLPMPFVQAGVVIAAAPEVRPGPHGVIVVLGGGAGMNAEMLTAIGWATKSQRKAGMQVRCVAGPLADLRRLQSITSDWRNFEILRSGTTEEMVLEADLVISHCGYNTGLSLIQTPLPLIFVPLEAGNQEQLSRAERLSEYENVQLVREGGHDFVPKLAKAIESGLAKGSVKRKLAFSIDGATRAAAMIHGLAAGHSITEIQSKYALA